MNVQQLFILVYFDESSVQHLQWDLEDKVVKADNGIVGTAKQKSAEQ